jgi:hypothetical protein
MPEEGRLQAHRSLKKNAADDVCSVVMAGLVPAIPIGKAVLT